MRETPNRNATPVAFGWDFQINAAIILFLQDIENVDAVRVEGKLEDIQVYKDHSLVLAQCKAVTQEGDYRSVVSNLKKALESLYDGSKKTACVELIYITNSDRPLGIEDHRFSGPEITQHEYDELTLESKDKIDAILSENGILDFEKEKFRICVIPFCGSDFNTRYKYILQELSRLLSDMDLNTSLDKRLLIVWQQMLFQNASGKPLDLTITKGDLLWPLIVLLIDRVTYDWLEDDYDESVLDELEQKYRQLITFCENKIQLCFDIVHDFETYQYTGKPGDKIKSFAREYCEKYKKIIAESIADPEEKEALTKMILYKILTKRKIINDIHANLNLK